MEIYPIIIAAFSPTGTAIPRAMLLVWLKIIQQQRDSFLVFQSSRDNQTSDGEEKHHQVCVTNEARQKWTNDDAAT